MSGGRPWYAGKVARRSGGRAPVDVLVRRGAEDWEPIEVPRKLFPKTGQVELQGSAALEASAGEWVAFQVADEGRPGARQVRVGAHRFLSRFADLRGLGTVEAARFLLTREGWDGAAEAGHWSVRFSDDRVLTMQLERARDGRLRCADRSLGKVACLSFDEGCAFTEPSGATGRTLYDPADAPPLAVHDWSPGADYVAHVVRALAGADDPRLPELIAWLDLHREEKTGRVSAIGTDHELAFEALRSGDLAARLRADREVMAAYLAAARGDPQIAAAVEAAIAREAAHAREDARAAAEREFETELDGRRAEQAARIAAREAALAKAADERSSARERELSADLERRLAQRAAQGEEDARRHREEAAATVEAARSERERLEAECDALDARAGELRSEADRLEEAARAAAERATAAEREFAERARRGIATPRAVTEIARADAGAVASFDVAELGTRIASCALLTPAGKALMADFAALALAGEVPVLHGPQAEDFALVAEALLAAGRLVPFDADETVIAPDDIWSRPGSGLASQVSQAAALASEGHVHLVQLRGIERSAARSWHPALAALARRGLIPRRLLLFATLLDQDASEAASLPPGTCRLAVEGAVAPGAALLAPRLLGSGSLAGRLDPGDRAQDLSAADAALASLAADGTDLEVAVAVRTARIAAEAAAITPDDGTAGERAARRFLTIIRGSTGS